MRIGWGFSGGQAQDDSIQPNNGSIPLAQCEHHAGHPHNECNTTLLQKVATLVTVNLRLEDIDLKIEERMKVAAKARHLSDILDVLSAAFQCWGYARRAHLTIDLDVCPQQNVSNGLNKTNGHGFHVVNVGINMHSDPTTAPLNGCVNDTKLFRDYLRQDLSVPANQITLLLSLTGGELIAFPCKAPTQGNILNAIYDLYENSDIETDDSMTVYAGHGRSYPGAK
ncbi:hypothetical protein BDP27DRAFT_1373178 [Rhodocollybia butyracea]|uniref:Peptidase C14 caspase domain-containing protein n=1 Tax=Rhodocollybia butyracea TaxID=206335 RepID=A0A9P5P9L9_9AGAR|nr:hypothetical protein BDP27DRAFT_1373178 [Rhodocollybia butyracea]